VANRVGSDRAYFRDSRRRHLFALGELAGAYSAAKHGGAGKAWQKFALRVHRHRAFATMKLHGTYIAKAGFDLRRGLSIDIRPDQIMVQLPHAQILGVEQQQVDVLAFENGLWNRISGQDVQSELSALPELAWKKAAESGLPAEAQEVLQQQLEQRIRTAQPLRLIFNDEKKSE